MRWSWVALFTIGLLTACNSSQKDADAPAQAGKEAGAGRVEPAPQPAPRPHEGSVSGALGTPGSAARSAVSTPPAEVQEKVESVQAASSDTDPTAASEASVPPAGAVAATPQSPAAVSPGTPQADPAASPAASAGTPADAAAAAASPAADAASIPGLETQKARVSYSIGLDIGRNIKSQEVDIDVAMLSQGLEDALGGETPLMSDEQVAATMQALQQEMMSKKQEKMRAAAEKNKAEGDAFLAQNKTQPGVVELPSGLQYKILTEGTGPSPKDTDQVSVHYRGTLIDGTEFDSSYGRGQPATFPVNGVIRGWTEALQLMKAGSKWQLWIPPQLGYGERGTGREIGPNAVLLFEVELLEVKGQ